jgi:hypothetical protein
MSDTLKGVRHIKSYKPVSRILWLCIAALAMTNYFVLLTGRNRKVTIIYLFPQLPAGLKLPTL